MFAWERPKVNGKEAGDECDQISKQQILLQK